MSDSTMTHFEKAFGPPTDVVEREIEYGLARMDGSRATRAARFATFRVQDREPGWIVVTLDLSEHDRVRPTVGTELSIHVPDHGGGAESGLQILEALSGYADERPGYGKLVEGRCEKANTLMWLEGSGSLAFVRDESAQFLDAVDKKATVLRVVHLTDSEARGVQVVGLRAVVEALTSDATVYDVTRAGTPTDTLRQLAVKCGSKTDSVGACFLSRRAGLLWRNVRLAIDHNAGEVLSFAIPARLERGEEVALTHCGKDIVFRRGPRPRLDRVGRPSARAVAAEWTSGWQLFVTLDADAEAEVIAALTTTDFTGALETIPRLSIAMMSWREIGDHLHVLGGRRATRTF